MPGGSRAPGYDNNVPVNSWLRGGKEDATRMPNFDRSRKFYPTKGKG